MPDLLLELRSEEIPARGAVSVTGWQGSILRVRNLAKARTDAFRITEAGDAEAR